MKKAGIVLVVSSLTVAIYLLYAYLQPTYSYHLLDARYDALKYAEAYNFFKGLVPDYSLSFPFNARILMPWLAAQLPFNDLKTDFIWLNGLFVVLTVGFLTFIWQNLQIRLPVILIGLFWVLFHWKGLVRMYLPDPVSADVGEYFWLTVFLALHFISKKKGSKWSGFLQAFCLILTAVLGTLQKESFIAVIGVTVLWGGLSVWLVETPTTASGTPTGAGLKTTAFRMTKGKLLILLSAFLMAVSAYYLVLYFFPASISDWRNNSLISLFRGVKRYILQPELFLRIPVSWLLAYGTFWLVLLSTPKPSPLTSHSSLLTLHFLLWLFLSVFGGGDTTRILFNGMPFIMTFLLFQLNQKPRWVAVYVLLTSLPFMRLLELEPDLGLYPPATQRWCVECWTLPESWGYWVYAIVVLAGYYYLLRCFGAVGGNETNHIHTNR
ncbi:MAG: hypothetical protein U0X91_14170 [Spirosomataceae bacterium]